MGNNVFRILLGFASYTYHFLTAAGRFEDGCLARDAQVIHLDDGSFACDFVFGDRAGHLRAVARGVGVRPRRKATPTMTAMRRLDQWPAENTGASLGAAGVLVALALGLTQAGGVWLAVGIMLAVVAGIWADFTIGAARSEAFRQALARAHRNGEAVRRSKPDNAQAEAWRRGVPDLIAAGLGESEAELFLSNHDLGIGHKSQKDTDTDVWMRRRLQRLARLLDRIHSMTARIDFDPKRWAQ